MRRGTCVASVCICLLAVGAILPAMADVLPPDYRLEPVARNLTSPQGLALAPDGRIFYIERTTGNVRIIQYGKPVADPFVTVSVPASSPEGGLLGIALHPRFATNGWVFLYYTKAANGKNRIERYTAQGNKGTAGYVVVDDIGPTAVGAGEDNGGGLVFGIDGNLYAGVGVMENDPQSQMDGSQLGKVLQIAFNPDGTVSTVQNHAKGFRNVAGLAVHPTTGTLYATDNYDADDTCDETNVVAAGANYGWDIASCGDGNQQTPLQTISPQTGVSAVVSAATSKFPVPKVCSSDPTRQANLHSVCSNDPNRPCWASKVCSNDSSRVCTWTKVCSTNASISCSSNLECAVYAGGGTCIPACGTGNTCVPYCGTGNTCMPPCGWGGTTVDAPTDPLYVGGGNGTIVRDVLAGSSYATLSSATAFYNVVNDPLATSCPVAITALEQGQDGDLWVVSNDPTPGKAGIYRIVSDPIGGTSAVPREISAGNILPLTVTKEGDGSIKVWWEDLKKEAWGCWTGHCPAGSRSARYTVWAGPLGSPFGYTHTALAETDGSVENDALRSYTVTPAPSDSQYYLVSARGAHLEGSLGKSSSGAERPGYPVTDLCQSIGYGSDIRDMNTCSAEWPHAYPDQNNKLWNWSDFRGKVVVLTMGQYG